MSNQQYKIINMRGNSRTMLGMCKDVVVDYQAQGYRLTLRQLYYQLVTKNVVPNEERSYANLSTLVSNGRLIGELDWDVIEDRGRLPKTPPQFDGLKDLVEAALHSYRLPRLVGQSHYVELWVEKDALAGVLAPLANKYHLVLQVNKGYASQSSMWEAACRIDRACRSEESEIERDAIILYLGDLDPSGEDMVRDIQERLRLFLRGYVDGVWDGAGRADREEFEEAEHRSPGMDASIFYDDEAVELIVNKIGITPEQVQQYKPPPNPAKLSDSRARAFIAKHGRHSYEVDALPPQVLRALIVGNVESYLDMDTMAVIIKKEDNDKAQLRLAVQKLTKEVK